MKAVMPVRLCIADIGKARDLLGLDQRVSFDRGMLELLTWGRGVEGRDSFQKAYVGLHSKGLSG